MFCQEGNNGETAQKRKTGLVNKSDQKNKYGAESFEECRYFRGKLEDFEEHYGIYYLAIGSGTHNKVQTELTVFTMSLCYNVEINVSIIPSLSMIILH